MSRSSSHYGHLAGMSRSPSHFGHLAGTSRSPSHIVSAPGQTGRRATPYWHLRRTGRIIGPGAVRPLAPHSRASDLADTAGSGSPHRMIALSNPDYRDPGRLRPGLPSPPGPDAMIGPSLPHLMVCDLVTTPRRGRLGPAIAPAGHSPSQRTTGWPARRPRARHSLVLTRPPCDSAWARIMRPWPTM